MDEFLKLYGSGDSAAMALGIFLAFLGLFAPKKFFGIEFDWTPATSAAALISGVAFFAFSYPQLRFWQSNTSNVDQATIAKLVLDTQQGIDSINAARSGNSYPYCSDHAGAGLAPLNDAITILNKIAKAK
ncbi:hypothetical protein ABIB94_009257 [Bradyrhizobium sp. JR7.2]|jgi:hypothetical protein|uniref:hypothetical protein n=1 Tax=Bradyrhizobium TaxID=374 RepID=UPI0024AEDDAD|nr:hypothetical protein [Bradyrhizobium barranii]WFT91173.1 hypothetical protein QA633_22575 [Bradyrhizobium barranii]